MTGKNFCKIEKKWCKLCHKKTACVWQSEKPIPLGTIRRCPKRESTRTIRFKDFIKEVDFNDLMDAMCKWWPDQAKNRIAYFDVWNKLQEMEAVKTDWFIQVKMVHEDAVPEFDIEESYWLNVTGISPDKRVWGIEFSRWNEFLGMNITQETLDKIDKLDIIAAILYEMTWWGYTEDDVKNECERLMDTYEEMINESKNK